MSKLIIVCGLPGSGKTTLAKELSKKLRIVCFHKDTIKEKLYDLFGGNNLKDSSEIGLRSVGLLFRLAEEQISRGINLIIEAPFNYTEDYKLFSRWVKKYKLNLYSVVCLTDSNTRKIRFENRERHKSHHDQDRRVFFDDKYDYKNIPGKQIRINTDVAVNKLVEKIIQKIS